MEPVGFLQFGFTDARGGRFVGQNPQGELLLKPGAQSAQTFAVVARAPRLPVRLDPVHDQMRVDLWRVVMHYTDGLQATKLLNDGREKLCPLLGREHFTRCE